MRTGGCSIQQSLTPEAATIVKQAINLARRRGHAQVTPIHVASVMLASPAGLLRAACLKSHSHPFQCKALELCFNVALNRLPTTTPAPILGPQSHYPALANALMAAFKRAQAHQRRGSIESQQQPILALKIETEQLVISILDDPSVSRVMREAGFSSTHVKSNVEQAVALLESSSQITTTTTTNTNTTNMTPLGSQSYPLQAIPPPQQQASNHFDLAFSKPYNTTQVARSEDVSIVVESWAKRRDRSSVVLVGECLGSCEGVVRGVKERAERGDVPLELRYAQFLNCPLLSMKNLSRDEIDLKLGEIRCLLKGYCGVNRSTSSGVVLYLGDLRWVAEYWAYYGEQRRHYYCPVEHLVMGLRRLVFGNVEINARVWLMGIATFNTFIKCKSGNPSLETLLDLHALTIPSGSLDLSLNLDSSSQGQNKSSLSGDHGMISWPLLEHKTEMRLELTCCTDCSANCHREARSLAGSIRNNESTTTTTTTTTTSTTSSSLPSWLQKCKEESSREPSPNNDQEETLQMKELCKKWNLICNTAHKASNNILFHAEKTINFSSCSPSSSNSISSYETKPITATWPNIIFEPKWSTFSKEHQFLIPNDPKPELLSNPNSTPNSASSSEATDPSSSTLLLRFKENNIENFESLCHALEKKVPWQKDVIPEIASTALRCRSGAVELETRAKHETWLFFLGPDDEGKVRVAKELAKLVFGSSSFKSIGLNSFSSTTRADSTENDSRSYKRGREESSGRGYLERFANEVRANPHRVFYVDDVELLDQCTQKGIRKAIETGKITLCDREVVDLEDAIVIFSCESFSSASRACSPPVRQKVEEEEEKEEKEELDEAIASSSFPPSLDLNVPVDDDNEQYTSSIGDIRILEAVDKQIFFKIQVL